MDTSLLLRSTRIFILALRHEVRFSHADQFSSIIATWNAQFNFKIGADLSIFAVKENLVNIFIAQLGETSVLIMPVLKKVVKAEQRAF